MMLCALIWRDVSRFKPPEILKSITLVVGAVARLACFSLLRANVVNYIDCLNAL